jgi:hypothetical protein
MGGDGGGGDYRYSVGQSPARTAVEDIHGAEILARQLLHEYMPRFGLGRKTGDS